MGNRTDRDRQTGRQTGLPGVASACAMALGLLQVSQLARVAHTICQICISKTVYVLYIETCITR